MAWTPESESELLAALDALDWPRVTDLCQLLIDHVHAAEDPYQLGPAKRILGKLREHRQFVLMQLVADAFIQGGMDEPIIRRQYAQALLDQGNLSAGIAVLDRLVLDTGDDDTENAEARGLLGRAYKQMYIAAEQGPVARRKRFLERAITEYRSVYDECGLRWHGINAVALLERARRDGIALEGVDDAGADARRLAEAILATITDLGDAADAWDAGTALEACVALGRTDKALESLRDYIVATQDAFSIASTLRQLGEVWALDPASDLGAHLLPVLQAELLRREGGPAVELDRADLTRAALDRIEADPAFEKVFGKDRFESLKWFRTGVERCYAIARIEDPLDGGLGTGFLLDGRLLRSDFPSIVLVTNAHVIPDGVSPERAVVTFRASDDGARQYGVEKVLWSSPKTDLDTTILALDGYPSEAACCPIARRRPTMTDQTQTYIIGHPGGDVDVRLSIRDNLVLDSDAVRLHYRTPTLGGSSGSPVFSRAWEVIAIHHAGSTEMQRLGGKEGTYEANEGIWIERVLEALGKTGGS